MPRMIVSIDGVVIKEVQLTKERTTLGRRPYNDIVIDNLAVSGEHAVLHMVGHDVEIEDLGSTNGTYVNAKAVKRQELRNGDTVEVGKYKIRFLQDAEGQNFEKTMIFKPGMVPPAVAAARPAAAAPAPAPISAVIRVMSGAAAGREVSLQKVVTTIGKPGVAVASITISCSFATSNQLLSKWNLSRILHFTVPLIPVSTLAAAGLHKLEKSFFVSFKRKEQMSTESGLSE